jgi:hypothetical protein
MHISDFNPLLLTSLGVLTAAFTLGAVDGVYFHLQRFRLFAQADSRYEHCLHTLRALLALPTLILLYLVEPTGAPLYLAAAAVAADQVLLVLDLVAERTSRIKMGGVPHAEYMIHVVANGLHAVAVALALASLPAAAWTAASGWQVASLPASARVLVAVLVVLAGITSAQHLWLLRPPRAQSVQVTAHDTFVRERS